MVVMADPITWKNGLIVRRGSHHLLLHSANEPFRRPWLDRSSVFCPTETNVELRFDVSVVTSNSGSATLRMYRRWLAGGEIAAKKATSPAAQAGRCTGRRCHVPWRDRGQETTFSIGKAKTAMRTLRQLRVCNNSNSVSHTGGQCASPHNLTSPIEEGARAGVPRDACTKLVVSAYSSTYAPKLR
jgi:hypothetical protein